LTKLIVFAGQKGSNYVKSVEVINLKESEPSKMCVNLPDIPLGVEGASGVLFNQYEPMYCGGFNGTNLCNCYVLREHEWQSTARLSVCRRYTASAFISAPTPKYAIGGGSKNNLGDQDIVESFDGKTWQKIESLPKPVGENCMVAINDSVLLSIGGLNGATGKETSETHFYDVATNSWSSGSNLTIPRFGLSCAVLNWRISNCENKQIVVAVGGYSYSSQYLSDVEFLCTNKTGSRWQSGPNLPKGIVYSALVEYKNTLILVGGQGTGGAESQHLYQLSSPDGSWVEMRETLKVARSKHIAFLIPDDLTTCHLIK
jgi:N-acetylneuraminic acid mutarotase